MGAVRPIVHPKDKGDPHPCQHRPEDRKAPWHVTGANIRAKLLDGSTQLPPGLHDRPGSAGSNGAQNGRRGAERRQFGRQSALEAECEVRLHTRVGAALAGEGNEQRLHSAVEIA